MKVIVHWLANNELPGGRYRYIEVSKCCQKQLHSQIITNETVVYNKLKCRKNNLEN